MRNIYLSAIILLTILSSCEKGLFSPLPEVETLPVTVIDATHVTLNGNILDEGRTAVTVRGFCWALKPNPTVNDNYSQNEFGPGQFTEDIVIMYDTIYSVKAYGTNSNGTSYGNEVSFSTDAGLPVLTTDSISEVTATSAIICTTLVDDGGLSIIERGVCWNTSGNPLITNDKQEHVTGVGASKCLIKGLLSNTDYFVRAYAINVLGIGYGEQLTLKTLDNPMIRGSATLEAGTTGDLSKAMVSLYLTVDDWNFYNPALTTNVSGLGSAVIFEFDGINPGDYYLDVWVDNDNSNHWNLGDFVGWYGTGNKNAPSLQPFTVAVGKTVTLNIICYKL